MKEQSSDSPLSNDSNTSSISKVFNEIVEIGNGIPIIKEEDEESIASKITS